MADVKPMKSDKNIGNMYDVAIIGAGAAGIACAKEALRRRLKTLLIEHTPDTFGGTCLNTGCIPTKFFLNSLKTHKTWLAVVGEVRTIIEKIKRPTVEHLKKTGVDIAFGQAAFSDENTLKINGEHITSRNIIIASGSLPKPLITHEKKMFAEELFGCKEVGKRLLIVGAGYIGIEFASLLNGFAKDITVVEKENGILTTFATDLTVRLQGILEKRGIKIDIAKNINDYSLNAFDKIILCVGRAPNTKDLQLDKPGIICDKNGWVKTDRFMRTNIKNIYACGDVTGKKLLAYIAECQAQICVNNIAGVKLAEDYRVLPECVFSIPQIARIGITENQAKNKNIKYRVIRANFMRFSSAYVYDDIEGVIQLIVDQRDRIIGAELISNFAADLINIFSLAIKQKITLTSFRKSIFIHPAISEIISLLLRDN